MFTGTPEGVSPIEAGDRIVATIEQIGTMPVATRADDEQAVVGDERRRLPAPRPRNRSMDGASTTFFTKPALTPERKEFYDRLERARARRRCGKCSARSFHRSRGPRRCRCCGTTTICGRC